MKYFTSLDVLYFIILFLDQCLCYCTWFFKEVFQGPKVGTQIFLFRPQIANLQTFFLLISKSQLPRFFFFCLLRPLAPPLPATTWPAEHKSLAINSIRFSRAETIWFSFENCTPLPFPYSHGIEKGFNFPTLGCNGYSNLLVRTPVDVC
jgi:hypothetical protein